MTLDSTEGTGQAEALRALRERYALATAAGGVGVWDRDLATDELYLDPALYALLGFAPTALAPAALWPGRLHPDDGERAQAMSQAALAPGAPRDSDGHTALPELECRVLHRDGGTRWLLVRGRVLRRADGTPQRMIGTATDITARKQHQAALRHSERRYQVLFEQASDPIFIITADGALLDANERACALLGYRREELLALTVFDLVETNPALFAATRAAFLAGSTVQDRRQARRKDGALVPIEFVARMLDDGRIQVIARERAEAALRASEARFRALYDADVMPICFWRADGGVTEANDALLALTGFSRDELAAGLLRWDGLTAPEHRDRDQRAFAEVLARGACMPYEKDLLLRDGRRVAVLNGGAILPEHEDGGVAFVIDLSERKRAEALLRELSTRLFHVQDEERRRIARELHDVTAQDLFAQSILLRHLARPGARLDRRGRETLAEVRALGEQALRDLRTQSYLLHPPLLDELGLATALAWLVEGFARRSGIAVELAVDEAVGRLPGAVELALYRVAQEGLGNVHRHAGSATARVALAREGDAVTLRVEDRGRGLPDPAAGGEEAPVTGVGLAGMRQRLRPLGGRLALASSDRGTTLTAVVPLPHEAAR